MYATGGRGGDVYHVTRLDDDSANPQPGMFRYAILTARRPRTIVFDVGGTIELETDAGLAVQKSYLTIAGQTAPGGGITIRSPRGIAFQVGTDVVVRHVRFRPGDEALEGGYHQWGQTDGLNLCLGLRNSIFDHCTMSWSIDENVGMRYDVAGITVQWCMLSEALDESIHSYSEHHSCGTLVRTDVDGGKIGFHHNLFAHNDFRNPRPGGDRGTLLNFDFTNNVVYNWGRTPAGYVTSDNNPLGDGLNMNYVGNYLRPGPDTPSSPLAFTVSGDLTQAAIYAQGNAMEDNPAGTADNWQMIVRNAGTLTKQTTPFDLGVITVTDAATAYDAVLGWAGATPWNRDSVDLRIIEEVLNGTGQIIDSQSEVGGWPDLGEVHRPADWDTDLDGMPNWWEELFDHLDPSVADHNGDLNGDGYTNLEEYLNYIPEPATLSLLCLGGLAVVRRRDK